MKDLEVGCPDFAIRCRRRRGAPRFCQILIVKKKKEISSNKVIQHIGGVLKKIM